MDRENPLSIEVLEELNYERFQEELKDLSQIIEADDDARMQWVEDAKEIRELADGKDERKNKPWKHASEVSIPLIKKMLRRWKPSLYNLVALADPVCSFYAGTADAADKTPTAERFFDWLIKIYMDNTLSEIQYLTNDVGLFGQGYLGVSWDYRTETQSRVIVVENLFEGGRPPQDISAVTQVLSTQYEVRPDDPQLRDVAVKILEGAKFVRLSKKKVIADKPKIVAHSPMSIISPPTSESTHDAEYVAIVHHVTNKQLRQMAFDGKLNPQKVTEFLASQRDENKSSNAESEYDQAVDKERRQDAGVNAEDDRFTLYQVYCRLDYNGDGVDERVVLWVVPDGLHVLALYAFPFSSPHWPVFRFEFEKESRNPNTSKGIGHLLQEIQKQLNKRHRARDDAIDIQLAPVFQERASSNLRPRNIKWGPGKVIQVQEIGDVAPVEKSPMNLHEYIQDEQLLQSYAEELLGTLLNDLQATGRKLERRTATEVQSVAQTSQAMSSMDSASFQSTMKLVWQFLWQLWLDLGPREIYFNVVGKRTPELFNKADYDKNFQLMPVGTPGNTDRQKQLAYGMQVLQLGMNDPTGQFNLPGIFRWVVQRIDDRLADIALIPRGQMQQMQVLEQAARAIGDGELPPDLAEAALSSGEIG